MSETEGLEPTPKSPSIDKALGSLTGTSRTGSIRAGRCVSCREAAGAFKDQLSRKEFSISGLCQRCQDQVFGQPDAGD